MRFAIFLIFCSQYCAGVDLLIGHKQALVVVTKDWDRLEGYLQCYERFGNNEMWRSCGKPKKVVLGENGLSWGIGLHPSVNGVQKKEGDGKSPAGIFSLGKVFGFAQPNEMTHLNMEYLQITPSTEAVDDPNSHYYNCIVEKNETSDWTSSEKMYNQPLYVLGCVVNHNFPNPIAGSGSAIFLHLWENQNSGTA